MFAELSDQQNTAMKNGKDLLIPMFYRRAVQDKVASENEGRPIFTELDYVQIHIPGDKNTIIDRKVRDDDKRRWAAQWQAYLDNASQPVEGTPLEQWPALSVSQIAELKALHIPTIEVLADLPENGLQKIGMGARELKARAKAFIDAAKGNGAIEKLAAENTRFLDRISNLEQQNAQLQQALNDIQSKLQSSSNKKKQ